MHRRAMVLSMGDELTLGQTLDTNARWISQRLVKRDIIPVEHVTLPDDLGAIVSALERAATLADVIVCTGGLGPTADDLTREALARATHDQLVEDAESLEQIRAWFHGRGRAMAPLNAVQALRPSRAIALHNRWGTAPGLMASIGSAMCFCLPGPPAEMTAMYEAAVEPALRPPPTRAVLIRSIHTVGLGESEVATRLGDLMRRDARVLVGTTASQGIVSVRLRHEIEDAGADRASDEIAEVERQVRAAVAGHVVWEGDASLAESLLETCRASGDSIATVESCTGGLVGSMLTEISGSSDVYRGGWVTYSNELKCSQVGVDPRVIEQHGAVSEAVAMAMATGGLAESGATVCISITGVAGPGGGTEHKPVGTVFVCAARRGHAPDCRHLRLTGGRDTVRRWSATAAMVLAHCAARRAQCPVLLRQVVRS